MSKNLKLFGTDGIRGKPGEFPLVPAFLEALGSAFSRLDDFRDGQIVLRGQPLLLVARDTRHSGPAMSERLIWGFKRSGWRACDLGVLPTPAISYLVRSRGASLGCVISASHNPPQYNGVKFFGSNGQKISRLWEENLERLLLEEAASWSLPQEDWLLPKKLSPRGQGFAAKQSSIEQEQYVDFLVSQVFSDVDFRGFRLVLDCAHGASSSYLADLFRRLGARVHVFGNKPNGHNINSGCGALYPKELAREVLRQKADLGFALDGDADRLMVVDEKGRVLPGEWVMATIALRRARLEEPGSRALVTTQVSNFALKNFLTARGIEVFETPVGDRWVLEELARQDLGFGGENSGHYIWLERLPSADGSLTAVLLAQMLRQANVPASKFFVHFSLMPQVTLQVAALPGKPALEALPTFLRELGAANKEMDQKGRVLVRYSGTEPILRILIEGSLGLSRLNMMAKNLEQAYLKAIK